MRTLLLLSLAINVLALGAGIRDIYLRGGLEYLRDRLGRHARIEPLNEDAMNYANRQTLFEYLPAPKHSIVFLGDSLTSGCEWGEFFPGALNRGIGGDTSIGVLGRIASITQLSPRAVFLMIGSNDQFNLRISPEQTVANIQAIIAEIRRASPETVVYLESNMPHGLTQTNIHARLVNQGLQPLGDGKAVVYIDLYSAFLDGNLLNSKFSSDGTHLNGDGYLLWKKLIEPYVLQPPAIKANN